jgi:hypothetical protein
MGVVMKEADMLSLIHALDSKGTGIDYHGFSTAIMQDDNMTGQPTRLGLNSTAVPPSMEAGGGSMHGAGVGHELSAPNLKMRRGMFKHAFTAPHGLVDVERYFQGVDRAGACSSTAALSV